MDANVQQLTLAVPFRSVPSQICLSIHPCKMLRPFCFKKRKKRLSVHEFLFHAISTFPIKFRFEICCGPSFSKKNVWVYLMMQKIRAGTAAEATLAVEINLVW